MEFFNLPGDVKYNLRCAMVAAEGKVFMYGGYDEHDAFDSNVYLFDVATKEWEIDDKHAHLFREGHLATYIGNGDILICGGVAGDESIESHEYCNELLLVYNLRTQYFTTPDLNPIDFNGTKQAVCLSEDGTKIYISGGIEGGVIFDELYVLDLLSKSWTGPIHFVNRFDHHITVYNNRIYSFGGLDQDLNIVLDKVSYIDLNDWSIGEITLPKRSLKKNINKYIDTGINNIVLDVFLPMPHLYQNQDIGPKISVYNLQGFKHQSTIRYGEISKQLGTFVDAYWWCKAVCIDRALLLFGGSVGHGTPEETGICSLLRIEFSELGVYESIPSEQHNLSCHFKNLLESQEFTDFSIYCWKTPEVVTEAFGEVRDAILTSEDFEDERVQVIKVHRAILAARWPYFRRLLESGMNESVKGRLFIPDPYRFVKALLHYIYTDSTDFLTEYGKDNTFGLNDYSEVLILANFYEVTDLKKKIVDHILRVLNIKPIHIDSEELADELLKLWYNLDIADEKFLLAKVINILRINWASIIETESFVNLDKLFILKLIRQLEDPKLKPVGSRPITPTNSVPSTFTRLEDEPDSPSQHTRSRLRLSHLIMDHF